MNKGFTLIEILVTITIMIILAAGAMALYSFFQTEQVLESVKTELIQQMRYQQERAKAGIGGTSYGVYFSGSNYTLYQGQNYAARNPASDIVHSLPAGFVFSGYQEVTFLLHQGSASPTGTLTIEKLSTNTSVTIQVNSVGLIY